MAQMHGCLPLPWFALHQASVVQLQDVMHTKAASGKACRLPGNMSHPLLVIGVDRVWIAIHSDNAPLPAGAQPTLQLWLCMQAS